MMKKELNVPGIKCAGSVDTIVKGLDDIQNLDNLVVDLASKKISFDFLSDEILEAVKQRLIQLGYPAQN